MQEDTDKNRPRFPLYLSALKYTYNRPLTTDTANIAMLRENPDGTRTPLTMPNHPKIKKSTLGTILTQARIPRDKFLDAYYK